MADEIFISYRRRDSAGTTGRLYDRLTKFFPTNSIFMDVDAGMHGLDFPKILEKRASECHVMLAVIGPGWLTAVGNDGLRRLDDPGDFVRLEIATALKRDIAVIPVLIDGAHLPPIEALPDDLKPLVRREAVELRNGRFNTDSDLVVAALDARLEGVLKSPRQRWWILGAITAALLIFLPAGGYYLHDQIERERQKAEQDAQERARSLGERTAFNDQQATAAQEVQRARHREQAVREAEEKLRIAKAEQEARDAAAAAAAAEIKRIAAEAAAKEMERAKRAAEEVAAAEAKKKELAEKEAAERKKREEDLAAAQAKLASRDPLISIVPGSRTVSRDTDCSSVPCPELVVVPQGEFLMGADTKEVDAVSKAHPDLARFAVRELPRRRMVIAAPFAVSKTHVTRGEFEAFVSATGHRTGIGCLFQAGASLDNVVANSWRHPGYEQNSDHPVVCIDWHDAMAYVRWLSGVTGRKYRLLSEAEAEYVARAATKPVQQPRYYFGNDASAICRHGNIADQTAATALGLPQTHVAACHDRFVRTAPVANFEANGFGVHDVLGNVLTWTSDCWGDTHEGNPGNGKPRGPNQPGADCERSVIKGASWYATPAFARSAARGRLPRGDRHFQVGLRVARDLDP